MAKLSKDKQKAVQDAQSSFLPLPDCVIHGRLRDVDTTREGPKGPYWSWEFECVTDQEFTVEGPDGKAVKVKTKGRRFWNNTSLSEEAAFSLERTFRAFEVPIDTDTDELLGRVVKLVIGQRTIGQGDRMGEVVNEIKNLKPADPDVKAEEEKELSDRKHIDEIFS